MKKTAIIGASTNPGRYAYAAAGMLMEYGHPIVPVGIHPGEVHGHPIVDFRKKLPIDNLDTMTLYLSPRNQKEWYEYLLSLRPKRIIFNPGTENQEFMDLAEAQDIEIVEGCTLVMLRTNQY